MQSRLYNGDCLEVMKDIPSESVDLIVTSPPYNLGGDFHICNYAQDGKRHRVTYGDYSTHKDSMDETDYQNWQIEVLNECHRLLNDKGVMFYNHKQRIVEGKIIHPIEWIAKSNFIISQIVILDFSSTANVDKRRFFPVHEYLFVLKKDKKVKLKNKDCLTDVWKMKKVSRKISGHPATFHYELPLRCIKSVYENGTTLDPFMGTGTVGKVCKDLNVNFIGIELDPTYYEIAKNRIEEAESKVQL